MIIDNSSSCHLKSTVAGMLCYKARLRSCKVWIRSVLRIAIKQCQIHTSLKYVQGKIFSEPSFKAVIPPMVKTCISTFRTFTPGVLIFSLVFLVWKKIVDQHYTAEFCIYQLNQHISKVFLVQYNPPQC